MSKQLDLVWILNATATACNHRAVTIGRANAIQGDESGKDPDDRQERLESFECVTCWYIHSPRMHTNRGVNRPCAICQASMRHGNSDIPLMCDKCAKEHRLCRQCGATIDLRERRKFEVKSDE